MWTGAVTVLFLVAFAVVILLLSRALRATSIAPVEARISRLEQRFEDHDEAHNRLSRSIDNLHRRLDSVPDEVVRRLTAH